MVSSNPSQQAPMPQHGESYRQFVVRAHQLLMPVVRDPDARNQAVWRAWYSVNGDPLGDRARQYFPPERYRTVPNVCYFFEHSTTGRDGKAQRYSVNDLADIIDEHNERGDTNSFSAIASRHTVDGIVPEHMEPRVLGFAGPYRLGMVGTDKPKFAVFADEHHDRTQLSTLDAKRRRSVEVNRFRDGRRPYFDPIAALGAESPRLALPVARYSVGAAAEEEVERYTFVAPAMVGTGNTFLKNDDSFKEQYENAPSPSQPPNHPESKPMDDNMIQQLVQALLSTPEMQWVKQQMTSSAGPNAPQPAAPVGGAASPVQPPVPPTGSPPHAGPPPHGGGMPKDDYMANPQRYSINDDETADLTERYQVMAEENAELRERYAALEAAHKRQFEETALLRQGFIGLEQRAVDAERSEAIKELYSRYPHFVVPEEEFERCLYARGSDMDAEGFARHMADIERYAQRSPIATTMLPEGRLPRQKVDAAEEADLAKAITDRYTSLADRGVIKTYEEIRGEIIKERQGQ